MTTIDIRQDIVVRGIYVGLMANWNHGCMSANLAFEQKLSHRQPQRLRKVGRERRPEEWDMR